jgi:endogenous inhibitor of DNA gyrase (YacG/DUF329 family)
MVDRNRKECPLCQTSQVHRLEEIDSPVYYICSICKLIYLDQEYLIPPEREKARYDKHRNSLEDAGYVQMFEQFIAQAVLPFVPKGGRTLDFGSGPVPVLQVLLERKGYPTEIYDPFYAPVKIYEGKKYDLITCTEVLEHIYQPQTAFSTFSSSLHAGGILAIMTQFYPSVEQFKSWWYRRDETHVRFYCTETFVWIGRHYPFETVWYNNKNIVILKRL